MLLGKFNYKVRHYVLLVLLFNCIFATTLIGGQGGPPQESPRIFYNNGNFGIGTSEPLDSLQISAENATFNVRLGIENRLGHYYRFQAYGASHSYLPNGFGIFDVSATANRLVINESGFVGIGVDSPESMLHVSGSLLLAENMTISGNIHFDGNTIQDGLMTGAWDFSAGTLSNIDGITSTVFTDGVSQMTQGMISSVVTLNVGNLLFHSQVIENPSGALVVEGITLENRDISGVRQLATQGDVFVEGNINASAYYVDGTDLATWLASGNGAWEKIGDNVFLSSGNVGIGTAAPRENLEVVGTIQATSFIGDGSQLSGVQRDLWGQRNNDIGYLLGNVGIGTIEPQGNFHIKGDGATNFILHDAQGNDTAGGKYRFHTDGNGHLNVIDERDNHSVRFHINQSGNLGIGMSSPSQKLDVAGNVNASAYYINGTDLATWLYSGNGTWEKNGDNIVLSSGNVGIGTPHPESKLDVMGNARMAFPGMSNSNIQLNADRYTQSIVFNSTGDGTNTATAKISGVFPNDGWSRSSLRFFTESRNGGEATGDDQSIERMRIDHYGNVGIGTIDPQGNLHIQGDGATNFILHDAQGNDTAGGKYRFHTDGNGHLNVIDERDNNSVRFHINQSGNVGIGTADPQSELAVNGRITAKEIVGDQIWTEQTVWADFVFQQGYPLLPLEALEQFIQQNKHLPDVPSESEIVGSKTNLAEMDAKLLQKIEETVLYILEQHNRINRLEEENSLIKARLAKLEGKRR